MGIKSSKDEPKRMAVKEKRSKKHVCLLVLHNVLEKPRDQIDEFCDALNEHPSEKIEIESHNDVLLLHVSDDTSTLSEPQRSEITKWILEHKGHIVLICLMTKYNLLDSIQDIIFENNPKIVFCFKSPPVTYENCIIINLDFEKATSAEVIKGHINDLASAILDETVQ